MPGASQESAGSTNVLWKVGLGALLIAVAVVLAISLFHKKPSGPQGEVTMICTAANCGNKWSMSLVDLGKAKPTRPTSDYEPPRYECPKCKQISAVQAKKCPKCGEPFLDRAAKRAPSGGPTCPHCGVDTLQYSREQNK
jgi:hypothetical protein